MNKWKTPADPWANDQSKMLAEFPTGAEGEHVETRVRWDSMSVAPFNAHRVPGRHRYNGTHCGRAGFEHESQGEPCRGRHCLYAPRMFASVRHIHSEGTLLDPEPTFALNTGQRYGPRVAAE